MSRIDELQRLHEAATPGPWRDVSTAILPHSNELWAKRVRDAYAIVALHNSWPAIHRVLLAARAVVGAQSAKVQEQAIEYLAKQMAALDGDKGAT